MISVVAECTIEDAAHAGVKRSRAFLLLLQNNVKIVGPARVRVCWPCVA